jgi:uncharacterized protein
VKNIMQSNLSLLTEAWIPVLRRLLNGSAIGTSHDILPGVRGLTGSASLDREFVKSVGLLKRAAIRWGMIYVVHKGSVGNARELYYYFRNLGADSIRFNPLCPEGAARSETCGPLLLAPEDYGQFLLELLDVWVDNGCQGEVPPVSEWWRAFAGRETQLICDCLGQCWSTHLAVDPDGEAYLCSRASDAREHPLGNVFSQPMSVIMNHPLRKALSTRTDTLAGGECAGCHYFRVCHGGCPMSSRVYFDNYHRKTIWCESRRRIFRRMEQIVGHTLQGRAQ